MTSKNTIDPVTVGMAGVIYTTGGPTTEGRDESWLSLGFRTTASTIRTEWRSDDMVVVTAHHGAESHVLPGPERRPVPSLDGHQGLFFGHFFELNGGIQQPEHISEQALAAFRTHGARSFGSINGGWVGVVWDRRSQEARFVRDSVGSHAIYAARLTDRIVFSTDLRVFQRVAMLTEIDEDSIAQFLRFLYIPPPKTISKGCFAVHAGHVLTIGRSVRQDRHSATRFVEGPMRQSPPVERELEEQLPAFEDKLLAAVSECVPPTGRVALSLSGGQDSATLAVALSKLCPDRVLAFTVGERNERMSEANHAALVCRSLGLTHQIYVPSDGDIASGIGEFARHNDQPMGDLAAFAYFLGMKQLPDDCAVVLDGSGNDDYFGITGSALELRYKTRAEIQRFVPNFLWSLVPWAMSHGHAGFKALGRHWARPIEESFVPWEGWSAGELTELFQRPISMADTHLWSVMRGGDLQRWRLVMTEAIGGIWEAQTGFAKGVHFAHSLGLGIRYPFIDERITAWVHQLPMELKLDKMILRAYMAKNLPAEIVDKPKSGFIFDLNRLFLNPEYPWADELSRAGLFRVLSTWSDRPIRKVLDSHAREPEDLRWQHRLYALCLLATVQDSRQH
jgi:asparagine synthase (glutamine-hydrolysing)